MNKSLRCGFRLFAAAVLLVLTWPGEDAVARTVKKTKPNVVTNVYWAVSSTDAASNSLEVQKSDNSSNLTLKVSANAAITLEGKPAKLADLQKGVKVSFMMLGDMCSRIDAVAVSSDKKTTKKK